MPVLDSRRDVHHITRMQHLGLLAPFLIAAPASHTDQDLTTAFVGMVDVPVIPASRLKGDIEYPYLTGGEGGKLALAGKILGKAIVGAANGEHHSVGVSLFATVRRISLAPDLLCHAEGCPRFRPARIKGRMGQDIRDLFPRDPILLGHHQMVLE